MTVTSSVALAVSLRRAVLARYPEYNLEGPEAAARLVADVDVGEADLVAVRVLDGRAVIRLWKAPGRFQDVAQRGRIDVKLEDAEALAWVRQTLIELAPSFDNSLELYLDAAHAALLDGLAPTGLQQRLAFIHGAPEAALQGLRTKKIERESGTQITQMTTAHLDAVIVMLREVFSESPAHGMVPLAVDITPALQARLDQFVRANLERSVSDGDAFVVLRDREVVGQGATFIRQDDLLARVGGVSIALRPEVRGRGVGTRLYEVILERMVARGVDVMLGRTSNPRVLRLAERMRRPLRAWQLEKAIARPVIS